MLVSVAEVATEAVAREVAMAVDEEVNNKIYFKIKYCE